MRWSSQVFKQGCGVSGSSVFALRDAMAIFGKAPLLIAVFLRARKAFKLLCLAKLQTRRVDRILQGSGRRAS
jgi:hypothetical protein